MPGSPEPIIYIDRSDIRPGRLEALEAEIGRLVAFVEENEPQLISYAFYLDRDLNRMTVVAVHPDAASLELHLQVAAPRFAAFTELITLRAIEVYGRPGPGALEQLRQKAALLGDGGSVVVRERHAGFARAAPRRRG